MLVMLQRRYLVPIFIELSSCATRQLAVEAEIAFGIGPNLTPHSRLSSIQSANTVLHGLVGTDAFSTVAY